MGLPRDPVILLSAVNTKLRDFYPSLDALCEDMQARREDIEETLGALGYKYDDARNQFVV